MPLCTLLGGNHQDDILLYRAISQGTPKEMAALVQKYKTMVCIILVEFKTFYVLKNPILCIILVFCKGTDLSEGTDFFVISPNR